VAVPAVDRDVAVLRVAEPLVAIASLQGSLLRLSLVAAAVALLLALAIAYWIAGRHAIRIRELEAVAAAVGRGDGGARARELPADELGRLGRAFNRMSAELRLRVDALERERDMRERIVAHLGDGVALVDRAGRVMHANQAFATLLGEPAPPAPGTPFQEFARAPELAELVRRVREGGKNAEAGLGRLSAAGPGQLPAASLGRRAHAPRGRRRGRPGQGRSRADRAGDRKPPRQRPQVHGARRDLRDDRRRRGACVVRGGRHRPRNSARGPAADLR